MLDKHGYKIVRGATVMNCEPHCGIKHTARGEILDFHSDGRCSVRWFVMGKTTFPQSDTLIVVRDVEGLFD